MKKFAYATLKNIVDDLSGHIFNNRIANISVINSRDLLVSFTTYRNEKFLISLDHQLPFVSFVEVDESIPTQVGKVNDTLRKELKNGLITEVSTLNEDRILKIQIEKVNDYFEKEVRKFIIELIPHRPNLIILDENDTVLFAYHYSSLETKYIVIKGLTYCPLAKSENYKNQIDPISVEEMKIEAKKYLVESKEKRSQERYAPLYKFVNSRIKTLHNKLKVLDIEISQAKKTLVYQDHGNYLLAYSGDLSEVLAYVKSCNLQYRDDISIGENANLYFKKYKKAKRTIEIDGQELDKCNKEIQRFESIKATLMYMNEDELYELSSDLIPAKTKIQKHNSSKKIISYVTYNGTKIYFGKNSEQNDLLTFSKAKKDSFYLHVKDYHGSHINIDSPNPDNETVLVAAEICLILSNKQDGDVYYAKISDIKKGSFKGEALMNKYTLIHINNVRESTKTLLSEYKY